MGQAKLRGTKEERKKAAIARNKKIAAHYGINFKELTRSQIARMSNFWHHLTKSQREEILEPKPDGDS